MKDEGRWCRLSGSGAGAPGHRVEATGRERMAPEDSPQPQPGPDEGAVDPEALLGIGGARRLEATARPEERCQSRAVRPHDFDQQRGHQVTREPQESFHREAPEEPSRFARSPSSSAKSAVRAPTAEPRARITTSIPRGKSCGACRHPSRTILLMRFLATAFPTLRVTVIPNLAAAATSAVAVSARRSTKNWKCRPPTRRPRPCTSRNSRRLRRRRPRGNRNRSATRGPRRPRRYFFEMVTVSCLRPLRRRRRRISRPAAVFIRLRNPWVRLRLLRWG
jgi:hypothetical protein